MCHSFAPVELFGQTRSNRAFASRSLYKYLDLTAEQATTRETLLRSYIQQLPNKTDREIQELEAKINQEFVNSLNAKQRKIVEQFDNFIHCGGKRVVATLHSTASRKLLQLSEKQIDKLRRLSKDQKEAVEDAAEKCAKELTDIEKGTEKKFEQLLITQQYDDYKNHLGEKFDFAKCNRSIALAYSRAITMNAPGSTIFSSNERINPLLIVAPSAKVDCSIRYPCLIELGADQVVANDIDLSQGQRREIAKVHEEIVERFKMLRHIERQAPNEKNKSKIKVKPADDSKSDLLDFTKDEKSQIEALEKELGKNKFNRLIQIYRRFAIETGAPNQATVMHKDWPRFLDMTEKQENEFRQHQKAFAGKVLKAKKEFGRQNVVKQHYQKGLDLLTDEQKKTWLKSTRIFGVVAKTGIQPRSRN